MYCVCNKYILYMYMYMYTYVYTYSEVGSLESRLSSLRISACYGDCFWSQLLAGRTNCAFHAPSVSTFTRVLHLFPGRLRFRGPFCLGDCHVIAMVYLKWRTGNLCKSWCFIIFHPNCYWHLGYLWWKKCVG